MEGGLLRGDEIRTTKTSLKARSKHENSGFHSCYLTLNNFFSLVFKYFYPKQVEMTIVHSNMYALAFVEMTIIHSNMYDWLNI